MKILARYSGPADLLVDGHRCWPAEVDLVAEEEDDGIRHWHGRIQALEEGKWAAFNAGRVQLRMPDGRIGDFVLRSGEITGSGPGEVSGSGRPPFGDL